MANLLLSYSPQACCKKSKAAEHSQILSSSQYQFGNKLSCFDKLDMGKKLVSRRMQSVTSPFYPDSASKLHVTYKVSNEETEQQITTFTETEDIRKAHTYLFRTENSDLVKVYVKKKKLKHSLYVEVSSLQLHGKGEGLVLCWAIYRANSSSFIQLDLNSSTTDARTGMNISPFPPSCFGTFAIELEFDAKEVPFYFSFFLRSSIHAESSGLEIRSHRKTNFCVPVGSLPGYPFPLGLSFSPDGSINFAIFSRHAESMILCLYDKTSLEKPALELDLDPYVNRSGDIWHISFESAWTFVSYGYRCRGVVQGNRNDNDTEHIFPDPYAKITRNSYPNGHVSGLLQKYLGCLYKEPAFDWGDDCHLNLPMEKLVVYRLNVQRFTQHKSSQLPSDLAGTFAGLAEKLQHFKDLGVNAVLLEPVFTFGEQKGPYFPCHFFSPMHIYGPSGDPVSTTNFLKEMVKKLHANGIEVLMEVAFTHTADIGALQGIDDLSYYSYANGVGDLKTQCALNCNYPIVQQLVLDSLRHWVTEFHIDGFSFINASYLLRGFHGEYLSRPPLVEAIAFDPLLSKTKIIADYWDPHDMVAKETHFPHWMRWAEMNTNFCNDVRNFLRGESLLSNLATRLSGSGDMFSDGRGPAFSFNFISKNFGLSLVDLVSFSSGELAAELSWNCGVEGPTNDTLVLERRLRQIRNYLFILFVSLGVPVLNMGDESGQSSGGSPAYGDRKPFDWNALKKSFGKETTKFISFLSSLRKRRSDLLESRDFLKEENIEWYGTDQAPPRWEDPSCKFLAVTLKAQRIDFPVSSESSDLWGDLFIAFNAADHSETVVLPPPPEGMSWCRLVDTALPFPVFFSTNGKLVLEQTQGFFTYEMKAHSCTFFEAIANHRIS